ncbi:MAG TPA: isoprenylcysteine carboxylmethyltransferase family protein [Anaerolineales bacterium]|nr:isoprenylcysteine carboxylmethyltransferase family protein [Anaerolineales bacterium]
MQTENIFRVILPILIVGFIAHRGYYTKKSAGPENDTLKQREKDLVTKLAEVLSLAGFVAMIAYVINPPWLSWAFLSFPVWLRWFGVGIALIGFALLQWAQVTLGRSWSDTPRMMKNQALIPSGPYQFIRHPIYTAFILILGSSLLISSNWLIGLTWAGMTVLDIASRIGFEESLMVEYFGDQYRECIKKTGRLLPKLIQ